MTHDVALIDADTVRAAHARALTAGLPAGDAARWQRVLDWAADLPVAAGDLAAAAPLLDVFTGHHRDPEGGPAPVDPQLQARLTDWFAAVGVTVTAMQTITGGFSRLMLNVTWTGGRGVVRIEQDGMFATEGTREVRVMRAVARHGYPVPHVLWQEPDPVAIGQPFFVMAHVAGAVRTDPAALDDLVRSVAALHRVDAVAEVAEVDGLADPAARHGQVNTAIRAQLDHWFGVYRRCVLAPLPALERAFAWLDDRLVPTGPPVVVHGDPGPGNALQDELGVTAVIDWEFAHAGDAAEDWAYLALIRGRRFGDAADWKQRLARVAGVEHDEPTWRAWDTYNQVKGACANLTALDVFRHSPNPTPDLLAIGVAVHLRFLDRAVALTTDQPACSERAR